MQKSVGVISHLRPDGLHVLGFVGLQRFHFTVFIASPLNRLQDGMLEFQHHDTRWCMKSTILGVRSFRVASQGHRLKLPQPWARALSVSLWRFLLARRASEGSGRDDPTPIRHRTKLVQRGVRFGRPLAGASG